MSLVEIVDETSGPPDLFVTCEHAGNALPDWVEPREHEWEWIEDHWGWDPGARPLVERLVEIENAYAVMARYSRLLCDPNRSRDQHDIVRSHVFDDPISFNEGLSESEVDERFAAFHEPYHDAVDEHLAGQLERNTDLFLVSMHTFNRVFGDEVRDLEVGVLFDDDNTYGERVASAIREEGFDTELNEPYSGYEDFIYSVKRHGTTHQIRYVELEVRNDLLETEEGVEDVARGLARALRRLPWYGDS